MQLKSFKEVLDELVPESERNKALDNFYNINYVVSTLLVKYRLKHNMSQKQFAEMLGVSHYLVCRYENGDYNFSLMQVCETPNISANCFWDILCFNLYFTKSVETT